MSTHILFKPLQILTFLVTAVVFLNSSFAATPQCLEIFSKEQSSTETPSDGLAMMERLVNASPKMSEMISLALLKRYWNSPEAIDISSAMRTNFIEESYGGKDFTTEHLQGNISSSLLDGKLNVNFYDVRLKDRLTGEPLQDNKTLKTISMDFARILVGVLRGATAVVPLNSSIDGIVIHSNVANTGLRDSLEKLGFTISSERQSGEGQTYWFVHAEWPFAE